MCSVQLRCAMCKTYMCSKQYMCTVCSIIVCVRNAAVTLVFNWALTYSLSTTAHSTVVSVLCTLHTTHCILNTAHSTLHTAQNDKVCNSLPTLQTAAISRSVIAFC